MLISYIKVYHAVIQLKSSTDVFNCAITQWTTPALCLLTNYIFGNIVYVKINVRISSEENCHYNYTHYTTSVPSIISEVDPMQYSITSYKKGFINICTIFKTLKLLPSKFVLR